MIETHPVESETLAKRCPDCEDLDESCPDIVDKVACWLYMPERGMCPFLRSN